MEFDDDDQLHFEAVIKMVRKTKDIYQEVGKKAHYCILEEGVDAICLLIKKDDVEAQSWYTFSMTYTSEFLLRMFCQAVGDDQYLYFISEKFNCTLNHWTSRSIWDYNTDRLNRKFAHILLCIMQGIVYLHKKAKTRHGKVSAESVYIVKGDAKIGNVLNMKHHQGKNFRDDYIDFANLVEDEFKRIQKTREIPYELRHFIKAIRNTNSISEFRYQMNHPVLLTPERRCHLRNDAKFASNNQSFLKKVKTHVDVNLGYNIDWRSRVELLPECLHIRSLKSHKKLTGNGASNFFLLSRNACNHVNDVQMCMKEEELDRVLNRIWPEFLCELFDALYRFNIKLPDLWNLESN